MKNENNVQLSIYQKVVETEFVDGVSNMFLSASAGSGKTFIIVYLSQFVKPSLKAIFVAFNTHIVEALKNRLPSHIPTKTMNSLGNASCRRASGRNPFLSQWKYANKAKDMVAAYSPWKDLKYNEKREYANILSSLIDKARCTVTDYNDEQALMEMAGKFNIEVKDVALYPMVKEAIEWGMDQFKQQNIVDYTDQLWMPYILDLDCEKYDFIMVDEAQDLNRLQHYMLKKSSHAGTRVVFVGDPCQCQPPDTIVTTKYGCNKEIKDLVIGDNVMSFIPSEGRYGTGVVNGISVTDFSGDLVVVKWKAKTTKTTPNHKFFVRWNQDYVHYHCVYLMRKGDSFRIGKTKLFYESSNCSYGLGSRMRQEQADYGWILGIYETEQEALFHEQLYSCKFGIPTLTFNEGIYGSGNKYKTHYTQDFLDFFYSEIGFLTGKAALLLSSLGMDIDYPLTTRGTLAKQGRTTTFIVNSCNLIAKYMCLPDTYSILQRDGEKISMSNRFPEYIPIKNIYREPYIGPVYGLSIDRETYVADGIPTHNSMYGFTGALVNSLQLLKEMLKAKEFSLPVCYRCPTSVIHVAQFFDKGRTLAHENAPEGKVEFILQSEIYNRVSAGDLILCRLTAPLVGVCIKLIAKNVPAKVLGREIGASLIKLVEDSMSKGDDGDTPDWNAFPDRLASHVALIREKLSRQNNMEQQIDLLNDKLDCINTCYRSTEFKTGNMKEFVAGIERLFDNNKSQITLCTVHKAKGLEADNVFIIQDKNGRECIPLIRQNQKQWELDQEINIGYVATTRAKKAMYICSSSKELIEKHRNFYVNGGIRAFFSKDSVSVTETEKTLPPPAMAPAITVRETEQPKPIRVLGEDEEPVNKKKFRIKPTDAPVEVPGYMQPELFERKVKQRKIVKISRVIDN